MPLSWELNIFHHMCLEGEIYVSNKNIRQKHGWGVNRMVVSVYSISLRARAANVFLVELNGSPFLS